MTTDLAIDLAHVEKTYKGKVRALKGIAMRVDRGSTFGLLGPNGAGKSTLVKILMTVIRPTACQGTMLSKPVGNKATLRRVGYLPEHHQFPPYLTANQLLDYIGAMADVPRAQRRSRTAELLELVSMSEWANKRLGTYSKGMRQRIGIAQALINDPQLILLDEPTDGVDPVGRRDIRDILLKLKSQGKTIFINSHLLSELEMVCDHVAILNHGSVVSQGTIDQLTESSRAYIIQLADASLDVLATTLAAHIQLSPPTPAPTSTNTRLGTLQHNDIAIELQHNTVTLRTTNPTHAQPILDALRSRDLTITAVTPKRASLEDLFMQAVQTPAPTARATGSKP